MNWLQAYQGWSLNTVESGVLELEEAIIILIYSWQFTAYVAVALRACRSRRSKFWVCWRSSMRLSGSSRSSSMRYQDAHSGSCNSDQHNESGINVHCCRVITELRPYHKLSSARFGKKILQQASCPSTFPRSNLHLGKYH